MRLFISYAHEDSEKVTELVEALSPFHQVWIDSANINPGSYWRHEIKRGIRHSQIFLFVASRPSCCSRECHWEIDLAIKYRKRIIPIILEDCHLRPDLARLQWILLEEDLEEGVRSLLSYLKPRPPYFWIALSLVEAVVIVVLAVFGR